MAAPGSGRARLAILLALAALLLGVSLPRLDAQGVVEGLRRGMRAQAAFVKGKALYDDRSYERARERFTEAVTLDPQHDEARALLGWTEYFLGDYRAAAITFKTSLRRHPDWEGLYNGLGWSRLRLGRYHLASEAFRAALELSTDYTDALIGLGTAQFELGRYEAALPHLERAVRRLEPLVGEAPGELPGARAKFGWTLYYLGRYREALTEFEKGLRARPDWYGLHSGIGWCQLKLGRRPEARAAFQRALTLNPGYEDALEGLRQASS